MAVRMKDIASDLGVSAVTVSKVLRNQGRISPRTRERVLKRIKELNYEPNLVARSLAGGHSSLIGLIVPDLTHPFFAAMAKSLTGLLRAHGYAVAISSSEEDCKLEAQEISAFLTRRVDALVLASSHSSRAGGIFKRMEQENVPFVLADRKVTGLKSHFVGSDDERIGEMATEHLIERGYRRIAHIRRPGISTGVNRYRGYEAALKRHGLQVRPEFVASAKSGDDHGEQCGYEAMQHLLELRRMPTAVFCYNDIIGFGALRAILEAGLKVPSDMAVIGVSNLASFAYWQIGQVTLTTIDQDVPGIAKAISRLVLELVQENRQRKFESVLLPPKLIVGTST